MGGMDLHAVDADLPGQEGASDERLLDVLQLLPRRRAPVWPGAVGQARGAEGGIGRVRTVAAFLADGALVPELHKHRPAGRLHLGDDAGPGVLGGGVDPGEQGNLGRGGVIHRAGLGDHQAHAALDAAAVVVPELGQRHAVLAPLALHAGQDEAVGQGQGAQPERLEQRREVEIHPTIKAPGGRTVKPQPPIFRAISFWRSSSCLTACL